MDAVIAWVDGADPAHAEKRRRFAGEARGAHHTAAAETRFVERGEVLWCVASLLRFAPFLGRIHLVTDAQEPPGLDRFARAGLARPGRIRVVDHREVFRGLERALPTFNSKSIESVLWRIPGLHEEFIYLNDDFLLLRPVPPEAFFRGGRPVLRGRWVLADRMRPVKHLRAWGRRLLGRPPNNRPSFRVSQDNSARITGHARRLFLVGHHPHPMRRSTFERFFDARPGLLDSQVAPRFRHQAQLAPVALANHLELGEPGGLAVEGPLPVMYLDFSARRPPADPASRIRTAPEAFGCIQSLDMAPEAVGSEVARAVAERLGPALPPP